MTESISTVLRNAFRNFPLLSWNRFTKCLEMLIKFFFYFWNLLNIYFTVKEQLWQMSEQVYPKSSSQDVFGHPVANFRTISHILNGLPPLLQDYQGAMASVQTVVTTFLWTIILPTVLAILRRPAKYVTFRVVIWYKITYEATARAAPPPKKKHTKLKPFGT